MKSGLKDLVYIVAGLGRRSVSPLFYDGFYGDRSYKERMSE